MACQTKFFKLLVKIYLTQFHSVGKGRQPWDWDVYISSATNIVFEFRIALSKRDLFLVHVVNHKQNIAQSKRKRFNR